MKYRTLSRTGISVSNLALGTMAASRLQVPVTLQPQYSLVSRAIEYEIVPAALQNNIGLLPWSPLAGGFLSDKYRRSEQAQADTRAGNGDPMSAYIFGNLAAQEQNWAILDAVRDIAKRHDVTATQVALSWVANRPGVVAPIVGAKTLDQLEQNLIAGDLTLAEDDTARLDEVSTPTPNAYPYGAFGVKQRDRYIDSSDQAIQELF